MNRIAALPLPGDFPVLGFDACICMNRGGRGPFMKSARTFTLGSAATLIAICGAQAADLPAKAKAIEYVQICSAYGAGFWFIPGTDTCIKLGGYIRVDTTFNGGAQGQPAWNGDTGQQNRYRDYYSSRSRMAFTVDTRTATEYGAVRTFVQANFQFTTLGNNTFNPNNTNTTLGNNAQLLDSPGGGYVAVESIFVQFAGFTFGKSASAYASPWQAFPGNISSFLIGGHDTQTGVNNIQYTKQFDNGLSATIGLDDPVVWERTAVYNLAYGLNAIGTGGNAYAGVHAPDIVGNVRIDQAWGLVQVSGAAHQVNGSYDFLTAGTAQPTALSEIGGHPDSKWGGAVMAALQLKNLPTGPGDDIKVDATYAMGNTKEVISTSSTSPSFAMFGGSNRPGAYQSIGFGATTDAVWLPNHATTGPVTTGFLGTGELKLTEAYGIRGAFNHNWNTNWSSSLFGSYSAVRYRGSTGDLTTAKGQYCAAYGVGKVVSADFTCNPDYNVSQLGVITRWVPVKNLTFSAEVMWVHLDQKFTGVATLAAAAPKPVTVYEFRDQNAVSLQLRAQRNF
jgi:porin-like protein